MAAELDEVLRSGLLTNGPNVRGLEEQAADHLGVKRVVVVSNCTSGLLLVLQALGSGGRAVVPSFTFSATAHVVRWTGGTPGLGGHRCRHADRRPMAGGRGMRRRRMERSDFISE